VVASRKSGAARAGAMAANNSSTKPRILEQAITVETPRLAQVDTYRQDLGWRYIFCNIMPQIAA
jgi:hypothetical protein